MRYEKTKNPNIIKKIETIESEIYLDRLQVDIDALQMQLDSIPKPKETPDQETLDCWNENRDMWAFDKEDIVMQLKEKQEHLQVLKGL